MRERERGTQHLVLVHGTAESYTCHTTVCSCILSMSSLSDTLL